jgi:Flp pilus assembly pilin Flp
LKEPSSTNLTNPKETVMVLTNAQKPNKPLSLCRDERGLSTVEYVILLVLMAVAGITIWNALGTTIVTKIKESNGRINTEVTTEDKSQGSADDNGG